MCGIAGLIGRPGTVLESYVQAMIAPIDYRGPDGCGTVAIPEEGVALGHRRLSILDLSDAGRQPMASDDGHLLMVFNGEIYNYVEIREELRSLGYTFRSSTDSEVLLKAYEQWGDRCLSRLMGMYAFAIWNRRTRTLFAARDRLGIKPLYYLVTADGQLAFASEIKSILAIPGARNGVEESLIPAYMDFGYVPGEQTLHRGVMRLLPGHSLEWRSGKLETKSYWSLDFGQRELGTHEEHVESIRGMFRESVDLHLRSDVPLGVFLSGGIDSSAVVGMLSPSASHGLKTFSVAYDFGPGYDETPFARQVASRFGTDHHEIRMDPAAFREMIPGFIWHMDEPVTEAAAISLLRVSQLARQQVVVCLSGEGSDELFAGYDFYRYNLFIEKARAVPGMGYLASMAAPLARALRIGKFAKYLELMQKPLEKRYQGISSYDSAATRSIWADDFRTVADSGNARCAAFLEGLFTRSGAWDPLDRMLHFDTKTWLVDDLLIKADRMSMAASIELRVPFLDHRLVEAAARLPMESKIRNGRTKAILKDAMRGLLPDTVIDRPKLGFPTPLELMFRAELFDYARDLLLSTKSTGRGLFSRAKVERLLDEHRKGLRDHHRQLWQLVVLEEWHQRFHD